MKKTKILGAAFSLAAVSFFSTVGQASASSPVWTASWSGDQVNSISVSGWSNQTLRMEARVSLGGSELRIRLSNPYVSTPAAIGHVTVGVQKNGSTTSSTPVTVTFSGNEAVTIPAGGYVESDAISESVPSNTRLLVSLYISTGADITVAPVHQFADETEFNYIGGDTSSSQYYSTTNGFGFTTYISEIDVQAAAPSTVVAIGDSITDGVSIPVDTDSRWTDYLSDRIASSGYAVVNQGIVGDRVITDLTNLPSITTRWSTDVLDVPGAVAVIDEGGINDLRNGATAAALESAQEALIASAHTAGLKVFLTTLTPCAGDSQCASAVDVQRLAYNTWVRSGVTDGYVDFDGAVGGSYSSSGQEELNPAYDSGDHLHPNQQGAAMMANAVNVSSF